MNISSVRLERGIFNMHGGIVTGGYAENGGKITLNNTIVRGGKTENASTYGGNIDVRRGGNVAASSEGTFIMNGGRIETAATANGYGNGIYVYDDSVLTLAGDATVSGL